MRAPPISTFTIPSQGDELEVQSGLGADDFLNDVCRRLHAVEHFRQVITFS